MTSFDQIMRAWKQLVEAGFDVAGKALEEQRAYALRVTEILAQSAPTKA